MPADERTFVMMHDGAPEHPKIEPLSDKAFRLWFNTICWCSRYLTDGYMPVSTFKRRSSPGARRELLAVGLVEEAGDYIRVHDYLEHQRSAKQVAEYREMKRRAGMKGNHERWHVGPKGTPQPDCPLCQDPVSEPDESSQLRSQPGSQVGSVDNSDEGQNLPRFSSSLASLTTDAPRSDDLGDVGHNQGSQNGVTSTGPSGGLSQLRSQVGSQTGRRAIAETETETETDLVVTLGGDRSSAVAGEKPPPPRSPCGFHVDDNRACRRCRRVLLTENPAAGYRSTTDQRVAGALALLRPEDDPPPPYPQLPGDR